MQYGNSLCRDKKVTKNRGLNRTMQYGNRKRMHMTGWKFKSLNRTMQYGNLGHGGKKMMLKKFKSYYVVWKQKPISTQEERDDRV